MKDMVTDGNEKLVGLATNVFESLFGEKPKEKNAHGAVTVSFSGCKDSTLMGEDTEIQAHVVGGELVLRSSWESSQPEQANKTLFKRLRKESQRFDFRCSKKPRVTLKLKRSFDDSSTKTEIVCAIQLLLMQTNNVRNTALPQLVA
jgi:hypothetical protein